MPVSFDRFKRVLFNSVTPELYNARKNKCIVAIDAAKKFVEDHNSFSDETKTEANISLANLEKRLAAADELAKKNIKSACENLEKVKKEARALPSHLQSFNFDRRNQQVAPSPEDRAQYQQLWSESQQAIEGLEIKIQTDRIYQQADATGFLENRTQLTSLLDSGNYAEAIQALERTNQSAVEFERAVLAEAPDGFERYQQLWSEYRQTIDGLKDKIQTNSLYDELDATVFQGHDTHLTSLLDNGNYADAILELGHTYRAAVDIERQKLERDAMLRADQAATRPQQEANGENPDQEKIQIYARNFAIGLEAENFEIPALNVEAFVIVDSFVKDLLDRNEYGYSWINVREECNNSVESSRAIFAETIREIDENWANLSEVEQLAKAMEVEDVLAFYGTVVEENLKQVVADFWAGMISRQKFLKKFKMECKVDIGFSTLTIATGSAAIALSFGTAAITAVAIAKAVVDIAVVANKLCRSAESMESHLYSNLVQIEELCVQRRTAKEEGRSQTASKTAQAAKEAATTAIGQISSLMMTTVSRTKKESKEYYGKLSLMEVKAGELYKKIQEAASTFSNVSDAENNETVTTARLKFEDMAAEFEKFNRNLRQKIEFGQLALDVCNEATREDYVPSITKPGTSGVAALLGLYALAGVIIFAATGGTVNISPL